MKRAHKPHTERLFYKLIYTAGIFEFTTHLYRWLGRGFCIRISKSVAWCYAMTNPHVREIVRKNLCLLTGREMTNQDAMKVFLNFASTIADYVSVGAMPKQQAASLGMMQTDFSVLNEAREKGQGVILAAGHFGFFEYGALTLGHRGYPVTVITFSEPTSQLTAWRAAYRQRWGAETIEIGPDPFSSLKVVQAIESGRFTALLADRPMGERQIAIDLPGGRIPFSISPALLGWVTGCTIFPVAVRRTDAGNYEIVAKPGLTVDRTKPRTEAIETTTRQLAASLFEEICRTPHQWYQFIPLEIT